MLIEELHKVFIEANQEICTDTRSIQKDALFFALKGPSFNANKFAVDAIRKGCSYAIVDEVFEDHPRLIKVDDVLIALQELATFHRGKFDIPVLAITGTNGKTTTKELMATVLQTKFNVLFTQGNFNNHIGVPLTLLGLKKEHEFAIIEMGANHQGEIDFLCNIANPNFGLITNIGKAHLEGFGGLEGVIKTKTEMYRFLEGKGLVFVNKSEPLLVQNSSFLIDKIEYGDQTDLFIDSIKEEYQLNLTINSKGQKLNIETNLIGAYNANNILTSIAVGVYFEVDQDLAIKALKNYQPNNNRSQLKQTDKGNLLVLDAYNANPSSLELAIKEFYRNNESGGALILGDMKELGDDSSSEHQKILSLLKETSQNFIIGPEFMKFNDDFSCDFYDSVESLKSSNVLSFLVNSTILIKGSRSMRLEEVVELL